MTFTSFDEFRLLVQPDLQVAGQWSIHLQRSPKPALNGPHGAIPPQVSQADLDQLRNPTAPPNLAALKQLGQKVMNTIMPGPLQFGFATCLAEAAAQNRGLRLVVATLGNGKSTGGIGGRELPLEAAFSQQLDFLAANVDTPVSRGIAAEADRNAVRVAPPLRILVVASEPTDMPPVHAAAERASILVALQQLIQSGAATVDFCDPPTQVQLNTLVQQRQYHVVHFIGHGDFEIVGLEPDPQPHLYFEDGTPARQRRAVDAQQLFTVLRNGNIPLVVLTACASAAAAPNGVDYPGMAFEGLAQTLVERHAGPLAAVAMQFDLEAAAAPVFSGAFYQRLLTPGASVDQAVAAARGELILQLGAGHRSWVNPTVYWRCIDGRLFEILKSPGLSAETERKQAELSAIIGEIEDVLRKLSTQSAEIQLATASLRAGWQARIQELMDERADLLGEVLLLHGATAAADQTIECALTLRLQAAAEIGDVRLALRFDQAEFELADSTPGANVAGDAVFRQANTGTPVILIRTASGGAIWPAGRYELARFLFRRKTSAVSPSQRIVLDESVVTRDGLAERDFRTLHAIVFAS